MSLVKYHTCKIPISHFSGNSMSTVTSSKNSGGYNQFVVPVCRQAILARIPAGRWDEPDAYKGPVAFLASNASDYMSGQIMLVDGGWMGG